MHLENIAAVQIDPAPKVVAGIVGVAPLVYSPVELLPSPVLLGRSNFTATLLAMPGGPPVSTEGRSPATTIGPMAVAPAFWMVNVKPSATGFVNWNVKSLVKVCTLTGVVQKALAA